MAGEHNKENIEVCVAVKADYWYGDEEGERTEEAIEDLYQKLFSTANTLGSNPSSLSAKSKAIKLFLFSIAKSETFSAACKSKVR